MKFIHLSDLHIGRRFKETSLIEDQKYILAEIINIIDNEQPQAVIIAGDVYDKTVPSAEAVQLFDDFLYRLAKRQLQVFVISGNHDSAERLSFGSRLFDTSGVHMSPVYDGNITPVQLQDEYGTVNVYMLPFVKPTHVRAVFEDAEIADYTDALGIAVDNMHVDINSRNILVTHQFVTGAERSDSEELSVGGSDNVDVSVFDAFDYVALGHIHGPQKIQRDTVRYCGTPLKYSFSECKHKKSVTVVEIQEKNNINIRTVSLIPLRDMREIKGKYDEIASKEFYDNINTDDYLHITLTDEEDVPHALGKLRVIYPNIMQLDYDNTRTRNSGFAGKAEDIEQKSPAELFAEFYEKQNAQPMSDRQKDFVQKLIEDIWEGEK